MIAFAHIPKTAGTTLTAILRRNLGIRHFDTRGVTGKGLMHAEELRGVQKLYPRLLSIAGHGVSPAGDLHQACDRMRYYTFLRNPRKRCLSHFRFALACLAKRKKFPADLLAYFHEFLQEHRNWHTRQLSGQESADKAIEMIARRVSFVGCVERFDESLVMFRQWSALPDLDIRYNTLNVSDARPTRGQFCIDALLKGQPQWASEVEEANQEDLRLYRWVADEIYPQQRQDYGPALSGDVMKFQTANAKAKSRSNDSLSAKAYRNLVYKPLRRFVLPQRAA